MVLYFSISHIFLFYGSDYLFYLFFGAPVLIVDDPRVEVFLSTIEWNNEDVSSKSSHSAASNAQESRKASFGECFRNWTRTLILKNRAGDSCNLIWRGWIEANRARVELGRVIWKGICPNMIEPCCLMLHLLYLLHLGQLMNVVIQIIVVIALQSWLLLHLVCGLKSIYEFLLLGLVIKFVLSQVAKGFILIFVAVIILLQLLLLPLMLWISVDVPCLTIGTIEFEVARVMIGVVTICVWIVVWL